MSGPHWFYPLALGLLAIAMLAARWAGPADLYDNDQPEQYGFIADAAFNDAWLVQYTVGTDDSRQRITPKPPMYTWLGALAVKIAGPRMGAYQAPAILATFIAAWLIFLMVRDTLDERTGFVAAAMWLSNYHVWKLMTTVRSDMLLATWMALALWLLLKQRRAWLRGDRPAAWLVLGFWLSIAAGYLTKGPVAGMPAVFGVGLVMWDRSWRRCRLPVQVLGGTLPFIAFLAWFWPAYQIGGEELWYFIVQKEHLDRVSGQGSGARRDTSPLAVPGYFLTRFIPWGILFTIALVARAWRPRPRNDAETIATSEPPRVEAGSVIPPGGGDRFTIGWAFAWVLLVIGFFMIPAGKRADYVLPAYIGGAIGAAALLAWVVPKPRYALGDAAWVVHLVLALIGIAAIFVGIGVQAPVDFMMKCMDRLDLRCAHPQSMSLWLIRLSGIIAVAAGVQAILWTHWRRYHVAAIAGCWAVVAMLSIRSHITDRAATTRDGEELLHVVHVIEHARRDEPDLPLVFYDSGYNPVMALLGINRPTDERAWNWKPPSGPFLFVTSEAAQSEPRVAALLPQADLLALTSKQVESNKALRIFRVDP